MSSLETVSKNLGKLVREIHKTASKQSAATAPASAPALSVNTLASNEIQPLSYAATAAKGQNANWELNEKKKTQALKLKHTLSNR